MKRDIAYVLDKCLARIAKGETVASCLERYAEDADALRPLLETAVVLQPFTAPAMPAADVSASRQAMFAAVDRQFAKTAVPAVAPSVFTRYTQGLSSFVSRLMGTDSQNIAYIGRFAAAMFIAIFAITGLGVSAASANAIPGDILYPIKTSTESVQLLFTTDQEQLQETFQLRRHDEVQSVLKIKRETEVQFQDVVTAISDGEWTVGDFTVLINAATISNGEPLIGDLVQITAVSTTSGSLIATKVTIIPSNTPPATDGGYPAPTQTPTTDAPPTPRATRTPRQTPIPTDKPATITPMPTNDEPMMTPMPTDDDPVEPTHQPRPTNAPTRQPNPTFEPTHQPNPTFEPPTEPTHEPPTEPTYEPPPEPTYEPPHEPTMEATYEPPTEPTHEPPMNSTDEPPMEPPETPEPGKAG